jgi:hypothetical protein
VQQMLLQVGIVYQQHLSALCRKIVSVGWSKGSIFRALQ